MQKVKTMTAKQIVAKLEKLKAQQAKLRDEFRDLADEVGEHFENAGEAVAVLEDAADAVSRLL